MPDPQSFTASVAQASATTDGRAGWSGNVGAVYVWRADDDRETATATLEWDLEGLHSAAAAGATGVELSITGNYSVELDTNRQAGNSAMFSVTLSVGRNRGGSYAQSDTERVEHAIDEDDSLEFVNEFYALRVSSSLTAFGFEDLAARFRVRCEATGGEGFGLSRGLCDAEGRNAGIAVGDLTVRYTFD